MMHRASKFKGYLLGNYVVIKITDRIGRGVHKDIIKIFKRFLILTLGASRPMRFIHRDLLY